MKFFRRRCRFAKVCESYQKEGYTCNNENEAKWYCGIYELHLWK